MSKDVCGHFDGIANVTLYACTDRSILVETSDGEKSTLSSDTIEDLIIWLYAVQDLSGFDPEIKDADASDASEPFLIITSNVSDDTYVGDSAGQEHRHHTVNGYAVALLRAKKLENFLDDEHHSEWCCGPYSKEARAMIDSYFQRLRIPLQVAHEGIFEEGWVEVVIDEKLSREWEYLQLYSGREAVLVWKNCS